VPSSNRGQRPTREEILDLGERFFYDGEYDAALTKFDEVIALAGDDAEAHYLRGRTLYFLGRDEDAESAYDRALDHAPDFAPALIHKAELFVRAFGWPDEALQLLDAAAELPLHRDDTIEASFVRGLACVDRGDYRKALEPLNRAVRGDADWTEAIRERGVCRFYLWRFEDARRDLERAAAGDPGDAEVQHYLAMIYDRIDRPDDARAAFERASEIDPHNFQTPHRVSREEFRRLAADALDQLPEDFQVRFDNISFGIEALPRKEMEVPPDVFGVFVGPPVTERSSFHPLLMPCRVLLFQRNLERIAGDGHVLIDEIGKTILHEVGHFFGLSEDDMVRLQIH